MAADEEYKTIQVTKKTWDRLGKQKKWGDRMNFNDVIEWLLNEVEKE